VRVPSEATPGEYTLRLSYDIGPLAGTLTGETIVPVAK